MDSVDAARGGWFQRNWKWAVPIGCLGMIVVFLAGIALLLGFVFSMVRSSDVYGQAMTQLRRSEAVVAELGLPLQPGWMVSGSIDTTGPAGSAELAVPVSGPAGNGTLYVVARKSAGRWSFQRLELELEDGRRVDLLAPPD